MILLGLDSRAGGTLAVFVDDQGRLLARQTHAGSDAARAATHGGQPASAVGVVLHDGDQVNGTAAVNPAAGIALAEQWSGAARGAGHVVGLSLDSSIHAGIVVGGRLFAGAHGLAADAAWMALNPVEREDYRRLGCLEAEVGTAGIIRRLVWRIKAGDRSRVQEMAAGNLNAITEQQVFEAARQGDGVAEAVVRDTARYIGMAVANLVAIVDPDVVVLGGAIAEAGDLLLEPTRMEMARRLSPAVGQQISVMPAAHGDASAAIGAARAAMLAAQGG